MSYYLVLEYPPASNEGTPIFECKQYSQASKEVKRLKEDWPENRYKILTSDKPKLMTQDSDDDNDSI